MRIALVVLFLLFSSPAYSQGFQPFAGSWNGSGIAHLGGGNEKFKCKSLNSGNADAIRITLRCASGKSSYELRSSVALVGSKVSGTWEFVTYGAAGAVLGNLAGDRLSGTMQGSGYSGRFTVTRSGSQLTMHVISNDGTSFNATLNK